jgi:hypothetical protein
VMSPDPTPVGLTSTTSAPTTFELGGERAHCPQQFGGAHAARLGRAGAGSDRGIEHIDVDREKDRAATDDRDRPPDALLDRQLATSCMNSDVMPCSRCQLNSRSPGQ